MVKYVKDIGVSRCTSVVVPVLKKGINLPKKDSETANGYFKSALFSNGPIKSRDLNTSIQILNNTIYNYFADNFGYTETIPDENVVNKYKDLTVKDLKKALRNLKSTNSDPTERRYVSRILRGKLRNNNTQSDPKQDERLNHDKYFQCNFWGYVKNVFEKKQSVLPTFTMSECFNYFRKTLAAIHPTKLFPLPSWIPPLRNPEIPFNLDPPTYQQVTSVIRRMKSSGSPCPLDQLSIICFKRCPFLRTHLTELIRAVWLSGLYLLNGKELALSSSIKRTTQTIPLIFDLSLLKPYLSSCLRNSMYSFLVSFRLKLLDRT